MFAVGVERGVGAQEDYTMSVRHSSIRHTRYAGLAHGHGARWTGSLMKRLVRTHWQLGLVLVPLIATPRHTAVAQSWSSKQRAPRVAAARPSATPWVPQQLARFCQA